MVRKRCFPSISIKAKGQGQCDEVFEGVQDFLDLNSPRFSKLPMLHEFSCLSLFIVWDLSQFMGPEVFVGPAFFKKHRKILKHQI